MTHNTLSNYYLVLLTTLAFTLQSCQGVFDNYDEPVTVKSVGGQIYIEADSWSKWHYVDLSAISDSTHLNSSYDASKSVVSYDIPMTAIGSKTTIHPTQQLSGQYMYWFDAFKQGKSYNYFTEFTPTDPQPDPTSWTFAVHRTEVRTNGCSAFETSLTDIDAVTKADFSTGNFVEDEWTENVVWSDSEKMMQNLVASQGIKINKVLSSWLDMDITTLPPPFTHNNHVFIIKLLDGTYGALQLKDYISSTSGTKCCLTIKYKYPL